MSKRNLPLPIDVSCRISHWTATSLNLGDVTSSEQALVSVSTGIDSEADVTAFAATEAHFLSASNCEKKLNILEEGETVNTDLMKKVLLNYYIGLLTLETENLCTTCSWPFARSLTRCRRYFFFFALHSPLIYALRTMLRVAGAELWGPNRFSNCFFLSLSPIFTIASSSKHSCAKWAPQIMECSVPGGGTAIYGLYGYVPLWRVWFSSSLL